MKRVLVVANETLAGKPLIDAVKRRGEGDEVRAHVISPQNQPKHGYVIYDEHVRDAARNRLDMTLALRREAVIAPQSDSNGDGDPHERLAQTLDDLEHAGLQAIGQVEHHDPYTAIQNALQFYAPDDIVISTFPETRSGWLRGDLIGRVEAATGKPVEHVVSEEG